MPQVSGQIGVAAGRHGQRQVGKMRRVEGIAHWHEFAAIEDTEVTEDRIDHSDTQWIGTAAPGDEVYRRVELVAVLADSMRVPARTFLVIDDEHLLASPSQKCRAREASLPAPMTTTSYLLSAASPFVARSTMRPRFLKVRARAFGVPRHRRNVFAQLTNACAISLLFWGPARKTVTLAVCKAGDGHRSAQWLPACKPWTQVFPISDNSRLSVPGTLLAWHWLMNRRKVPRAAFNLREVKSESMQGGGRLRKP